MEFERNQHITKVLKNYEMKGLKHKVPHDYCVNTRLDPFRSLTCLHQVCWFRCNGVAWSLFSDEVMRQYFKFPYL